MFYRFLYIAWRLFWGSILTLLVTILLFTGVLFLMFQTQPVKNYLTDRTERWFDEYYEGTLSIDRIGGMLPFQMELHDVALFYDDQTVAALGTVQVRVDVLALFRNQLTINDIYIEQPELHLETDESGNYTVIRALNRGRADEEPALTTPYDPIRVMDVYAPITRIADGRVSIVDWPEELQHPSLPRPFHIRNLDAELFLEFSDQLRYLDISYLTMLFENLGDKELSLSGQLYNDSRYLELNAMRIHLGDSHLHWNSEFAGINLMENNLKQQFREASWMFELQDSRFDPEELALALPQLPDDIPAMHFRFEGDGHSHILNMNNAELQAGNSRILFDTELENYLQPAAISYVADIRELNINNDELLTMVPGSADIPFSDWSALTVGGKLEGTADTARVDLGIDLPEGNITAEGGVRLGRPYTVDMILNGRQIDLAALEGWSEYSSQINSEVMLTGRRAAGGSPELEVKAHLYDSHIRNVVIPDLQLDAGYADQVVQHEFTYYQDESFIDGRGRIDLRRDRPHFVLSGRSSGLNLNVTTGRDNLPVSDWNMSYDINWHGMDADDSYGRVIVDVLPSVVNGSDLSSHQLYLDLNHPENQQRSFRLTSSFLDVLMDGRISISSLGGLYEHWAGYFAGQVPKEFLFKESDDILTPDQNQNIFNDTLQAEVLIDVKDSDMLSGYLPEAAEFRSTGRMRFDLHADYNKLDVNAEWQDEQAAWRQLQLDHPRLNLSSSFRHDRTLRESMEMDIDFQLRNLRYHDHEFEGLSWAMNVENEMLFSRNHIDRYGNDIRFSSVVGGMLTDSLIRFDINELAVGNEHYHWALEGDPVARYSDDGKLHVESFHLASGTDRIYIDGIFSESPRDSVAYRFVDVDLDRISGMIDGDVNFQGLLNADFITKSLTTHPVFHGDLTVEQLVFDDRIMGDVTLNSIYNSDLDRFDTDLQVIVDESKYAGEIEAINGVRQHVTAEGWVRAPGTHQDEDSLYYFDINALELDTWVLNYLLDNIFGDIEGRATGSGYITGDFDYIDFDSDFEIIQTSVTAVFFETEYELSGDVSVSRSEGVQIAQLDVRDNFNGSGVLSGNYDFNEFRPEKFMNFNLRMNNLQFLDKSEGPEAPFFGQVAGTGVVNISGSNISPYVRTVEPVRTTSRSRFSIPLAGQDMAESQGRFIRYVSDFREVDLGKRLAEDPEVLRQIDRSFLEVFRLDLQFVAADNSTVQLIFDPVTGEIVNARGSGRVRITLEDESLQIFGNFDITDGDYLFVGGDILTRRFILREGGSIRWEGDPANAFLDITAVYRTRANIAPLMGAAAEQTNRIPVELMLEITGPIDNIENDFYFDFPNAIDATQNAAVLNVLNSEEQKLLQATSLLFTGGFISGALVGDTQTQELGSTLQARAGQVGLSQLLSAQINTLLSDNLLNLDVDLNLLGFDQADLGIALRLFDDRLVLRREGELGGEETDIGDLGATYRINPNLSVEVFHRKDPMLMSILGAQAEVENVNGVGLEAQFRFNTWRELGSNIWRNVYTVFGLRSRDDDEEDGEGPMTGQAP